MTNINKTDNLAVNSFLFIYKVFFDNDQRLLLIIKDCIRCPCSVSRPLVFAPVSKLLEEINIYLII